MRKVLLLLIATCPGWVVQAQNYTTWRNGPLTGLLVQPDGGVCMMGGATEHDNAMRWFLQRANGGDILVLRASGSDGYNDYLYSELGVPVHSVETIRFNNAMAANDTYVHQRIQEADAIWFAGGDQWNYVNYWRGTAIDSLINVGITERNIVIGGTSAGMAILGGVYFSAQYESITSGAALADPYAPAMAGVSNEPFLEVPWMASVVTDSHYDDPDRRGRHFTFMARAITDHGTDVRGIACNEYVAVTIDAQGEARVWGEWPAYEEYAYFLQAHCYTPGTPEVCTPGSPLTWDHDGMAVKAYKVPGTMEGTHTLQLTDWRTGSGGIWEDWHAVQGAFITGTSDPMPECGLDVSAPAAHAAWVAQVGDGHYRLHAFTDPRTWSVHDALGRPVPVQVERYADGLLIITPPHAHGLFVLRVSGAAGVGTWKWIAE